MSDLTNKKLSPEEVQKKEAKKAMKAKKVASYEAIKAEAEKLKNNVIIEALKIVRPSMFGISSGGGGAVSTASKFIAEVTKAGSLNENRVFELFKVGRRDCAGYIRKHLKNTAPENRVWITFDKEKGVYKVAGKGAKVPQGWNGPIPTEEKVAIK